MNFRLKKKFNALGRRDFKRLYRHVKLLRCPHCRRVGYLILHGYLRGNDDMETTINIIRARRLFCSNRNRRLGCGRTVSVFLAQVIKRFTISTQHLWLFIKNITNGSDKIQSLRKTGLSYCQASAYRLYNKIYLNQSRLRALLLKKCPPPDHIQSRNPLIKTIAHLKRAFGRAPDPVAAFQLHFQIPFLV